MYYYSAVQLSKTTTTTILQRTDEIAWEQTADMVCSRLQHSVRYRSDSTSIMVRGRIDIMTIFRRKNLFRHNFWNCRNRVTWKKNQLRSGAVLRKEYQRPASSSGYRKLKLWLEIPLVHNDKGLNLSRDCGKRWMDLKDHAFSLNTFCSWVINQNPGSVNTARFKGAAAIRLRRHPFQVANDLIGGVTVAVPAHAIWKTNGK